MATSAFKSTSRRSTLLPSTTTTTKPHRRARSLSRVSRRPDSELTTTTPKGKFVNTARGSEFAAVSLDDLALEFFSSSAHETSNDEAKTREGRSARRSSEIGNLATDTVSSSLRRGRSISRLNSNNSSNSITNCGGKVEQSSTRRRRSVSVVRNRISDSEGISGGAKSSSSNSSGGKVAQSSSRRRRSLSVAHNQISDSESDRDLSLGYGRHSISKDLIAGRNQMSSSVLRAAPNGRRLERSISLKDISLLDDGYSSQSSVLTDEEPRYAYQSKFGTEKTIRTVYAQKKSEHPTDYGSSGLYEAIKKEVRHAVEGIRTELEQAVGRTNTTREVDEEEIYQSLSEAKQKYAALKQSEKCKQDLLAEIVLEEQQGRDLSKLVDEIVTNSKNATAPHRPARTRKRSNDRRMSSELGEEAEKFFLDFLSNVEDTDISSFDGERSDGSSTLGCTSRARSGTNDTEAENFHSPSVPLGTDGVILPWLQWESSNDASPLRKSIAQTPATPTALKFDAEEEMNFIQDPSYQSVSSRGSSSSNLFDSHRITTKEGGENISGALKRSQFDMEEYLHLQNKEDHLFEIYKARHRISSGGLLLCAGGL